MVRIAPVRLSFNPKTLWFDAGDMSLEEGQSVVVTTARGQEFGQVAGHIFDMAYEDTKKLKSPLKPVVRIAVAEDRRRNEEVAELSRTALPIFRRLAQETVPEMNPIAVEYLFDNTNKAVFYFDADGHVDFRELIKKLSAELSVRVDMRQIGVRDGARMVGGLGHCGQEICCRRLGGQFNPVTIRMAKEQELSLNPQKISGLCGRLLCCLRYEFDAYKDFHSRAPKKNATITTPDGEGVVVDLDVPREVISIKVGDDKPVRVPLADMDVPQGGGRPRAVGQEAWDKANEPKTSALEGILHFFGTSQLEDSDKLAEPGKVTYVPQSSRKREPRMDADATSSKKARKRRTHKGSTQAAEEKGSRARADKPQTSTPSVQRKQRRRSTTVGSDGAAVQSKGATSARKGASGARGASGAGGAGGAGGANNERAGAPQKTSKVGRNSSGLRASKMRRTHSKAESASDETSHTPKES